MSGTITRAPARIASQTKTAGSLEAPRRGICGRCRVPAPLLVDRLLGLRVEEVQALRVERQPDPLVHAKTRGRRDAGDHRVRADLDVDEDLVAQGLDHLDDGLDLAV